MPNVVIPKFPSWVRWILFGAFALFVVLLVMNNSFCGDCGLHSFNPGKDATNTIDSAYNSPATLKSSQRVTFQKEFSPLLVRGLGSSSGVQSYDRLCLSLGDFKGNSQFVLQQEVQIQQIKYEGSPGVNLKFHALCEFGQKSLSDTLNSYDLNLQLLDSCAPNFGSDANTEVCLFWLVAVK